MTTRTLLPLLIAIPLALASCRAKKPSETGPAVQADEDAYPLTTCVVSGEALGSMGDPVVKERDGVTVKFCCENCLPEFEKDPETYLAKLSQ